jgi:MFS family permease
MKTDPAREGWRSLLQRKWLLTLAVLLGGVLLHSMNVLMLTTVLPSIVGELGGIEMLSWPASAFLASSIVASSCAGVLATRFGLRKTYCGGVITFGIGALLCSGASAMGWIVAGRFVQGFGGGLEAATAYVVIRATFPEQLWARTIALMSGSWSVSVLLGPLVGGTFAHFGNWRGAFVAIAGVAGALTIGAFFALPAASGPRASGASAPTGRVALICAAIAGMSGGAASPSPLLKVFLIALAALAMVAMLRLDRSASTRLLPSDAFSWRTPTGTGLWLALLLCITFSPLQIYVPLFLQHLRGLDPLGAGFAVASASLGWTCASLVTAGAPKPVTDKLLLAGPVLMSVGLMGLALLLPHAAMFVVIAAIAVLGIGIGQCWPFVAQRVMAGAKAGDEAVAASSVPAVQQIGLALGAAIAGLVANVSGLSIAGNDGMLQAAFWVPASFVGAASLALLAAVRLRRLRASGSAEPMLRH